MLHSLMLITNTLNLRCGVHTVDKIWNLNLCQDYEINVYVNETKDFKYFETEWYTEQYTKAEVNEAEGVGYVSKSRYLEKNNILLYTQYMHRPL